MEPNTRYPVPLSVLLGAGPQLVFIYTCSRAGYQILLSILFTGSVVWYKILCFIFLLGPVLGARLNARSGTGYQILCFNLLSDPVLGAGSRSVFIYTGSGTGYQFLLSILFTGSVVGYKILCGLFFFIGSGTGYRAQCLIWYQVPDPKFLSNIRSSTGYRITICICLYRIQYQVPDLVKCSFYQICC